MSRLIFYLRSSLLNEYIFHPCLTHQINSCFRSTVQSYGTVLFSFPVFHTGRRFSCDYCDYSATTSSNLRRHARIHAGARPYLCPHCDHRTSTLDALKKHVLDSGCHPGLPLYVCPWCSDADTGSHSYSRSSCVGFNASGLAWRHLTTEHKEKVLNSERFKTLGRSTGNILLEVGPVVFS